MGERAARQMVAAPPACWSHAFPAIPDQVPGARRFLASLLDGSPLAGDSLVCLSELVTNAIQHSRSARPGGQFIVRAAFDAGTFRVEVEDQGGHWAPRADPGGQRGRGLLIVSQLAARWGFTTSSDTSRIVWFQMDLP